MKVRAEWAWWLEGRDKLGAGVQGGDSREELKRFNPAKVLYMVDEIPLYAEDYGSRGALRTWHGTQETWQDAEGWARHGAINLERIYGYGVRDYVPVNEVWGIEGLGDDPDAYRFMGQEWTPRFLDALQRELRGRGLPIYPEPDGVRTWLYGPSPGHNYEDNHVGLQHLAAAFKDPRVFGSIEHYYWEPSEGLLDGHWWVGPERIFKVRDKMLELGIDKPVWIGEFNRKINRNNPADIDLYAQEIRLFTQWANSLDFVLCATYFLWNCNDKSRDFYDLTVTRTPGLADRLSVPWDRQSEGEWATPVPSEPEAPRFLLGFKAYAAAYPEWVPLNRERPDYEGNAYQEILDTSTGMYGMLRWRKSDGVIDVFWRG